MDISDIFWAFLFKPPQPYTGLFFFILAAILKGQKWVWTFLLRPLQSFTGLFFQTGKTQRKFWKHRENILTAIINIESFFFFFFNSKNFSLTLLGKIFNFKALCTFVPTCYMSQFYPCIYSLCQNIHA